MAYIHATVSEGKLVTTTRGLRISKQKHGGTMFVNASIAGTEPPIQATDQSTLNPFPRSQLKFVHVGKGGKRLIKTKARPKPLKSASHRSHSTTADSAPQSSAVAAYSKALLAFTHQYEWPVWATFELPEGLTSAHKRLIFMSLLYAPILAYPFDEAGILSHNPLKDPAWYCLLMDNPVSVLNLISIGALLDCRRAGRCETTELTLLMSRMCSAVRQGLQDREKLGNCESTTVQTMGTLAMLAGYLGLTDQWHLHMSGIVNLISAEGKVEDVDPASLSAVRKADFTGAISAATKPYLPFRRQTQGGLPYADTDIEHITQNLQRHLLLCGVDQDVIDDIAACVEFQRCIVYLKAKKGAVKVDPVLLADHHDAAMHGLLSHPQPLSSSISGFESTPLATTASLGSASLTSVAIESALRILAILFMRESSIDLPCGEAVMHELLEVHLRQILVERHGTDIGRLGDRVDQSLVQESRRVQKPVLVWICLATGLLSRLKGFLLKGGRCSSNSNPVYADLLLDVLSEESRSTVSVTDEQLEFCRTLDLRCLAGEGWDERQAIRRILKEFAPTEPTVK